MPYRLLLTTHHVTSRAKVQRLTRAAEQLKVSVLIKRTIKPSGAMICEGDSELQAKEWLSIVKGLRYKGYRFIKGEQVPGPRVVNSGKDGVKAVDGAEQFNDELDTLSKTSDLKSWWKVAMGFSNRGDP